MDLEKYLNDIGKAAFVNYYEYFAKNLMPSQMVKIMTETWTVYSKRSRTSKARAIFREGLEKEALKIISQSNNVDAATRQKALMYLNN